MATKQKTWKLTILLLKDSVNSYEDALKSPASLTKGKLKPTPKFNGAVFFQQPQSRVPKWCDFLNPILTTNLTGIHNTSVSAVLFVKGNGRTFAVTFGYGRNLLKPDCFELGFGLRTALNRIDPSRVRSMDIRNYEDLVLSTRKQTSRNSELGTFGLDVAKDLLRAVTGEPDDRTFASRLTGADALTLNAPVTARGLGIKCGTILDAYRDTRYKSHFDWIDHLSEVRSPTLLSTLEGKLIIALKDGQTEKLHLAPSDPIDWQGVDGFKIGGAGRREFVDLDIDEYLNALGPRVEELTVQKLKSYLVKVRWTGNDQFADQWTVFNCIVWEVSSAGKLYALVDGKWFEVDTTFAKKVRAFVRKIAPPANPLPNAQVGESEGDYNERVVAADASLCLLDKKLVKPDDAASSIEFCDIFTKGKQFFHVKKKTRSATLSHLFSQGTIAAQAFLQDETVRVKVQEHLRADTSKTGFLSLIPRTRPTPSDYEVVYAVITKPNRDWPSSLPFFSQLNLMQHTKLLRGLGFQVSLQQVEER